MRLGEALSLRAQQASKMNELRQRILANTITQEGDEPQEKPQELIDEFVLLSGQHSELVLKIIRSNVGSDLIVALQEREHLRRWRNTLEQAARVAAQSQAGSRYMRTELKSVSHLNAAELHKQIDGLTEDLRALDARIQRANWDTELAE